MCGICGFIDKNNSLDKEILYKMNSTLKHRGPDDDGYYFGNGIGLGMRRLSILGIETGKQPIFNQSKTICVVYNGEIYNFREIKNDLTKKGFNFRTETDTEVIVYLYEHYGDDFVHYLKGMYAFALHDFDKSRTIIVRDRLGIKPLYYADINGKFLFGSELKSLVASGVIEKKPDPQSIDAYLTLNYIPAPRTIYKNVFKLKPGNMIIHEKNNYKIKQYWDVNFQGKLDYNVNEWCEILEKKIQNSVTSHLVSDVPVGAFLSGGIDSSLVVAFMAQFMDEDIDTFTMGFSGSYKSTINEIPYARAVSKKYSTIYNEYMVEPDFNKIINKILESFDEPFSDDSVIPSFYLSEMASNKVKVALSGLGGDELFGGYHRYSGFKLSLLYQKLPSTIHNKILKPFINNLKEPGSGSDRINHAKRFINTVDLELSKRYYRYMSCLDNNDKDLLYNDNFNKEVNYVKTEQVITDYFTKCQSPDPMDKVFYTDMKTYLPDDILTLSDRLSMCHSLELRVPFIDHELVELTSKISSNLKVRLFTKKFLLKKIARNYLPDNVINHRKQGFESPMALWLKTDLKEYCKDILSHNNISRHGLFNSNYIQYKMAEHFNSKEKNNKLLFSLIMLNLWIEQENITF